MKKGAGYVLKREVFTLPNILSMVRLLMIPVMAWLYCFEEKYLFAGALLILSGVTDVVDGIIARRFGLVTDLGKMLDPVADKLTQGAMLICLLMRFPMMLCPIVLMVLKEAFMLISGLMIMKRKDRVLYAKWHGKAATVLLYAMMTLHIFWYEIPSAVSNLAVWICTALIGLSFVLYALENIKELRAKDPIYEEKNH